MTISSFDTSAYIFECSCGERFKTVLIASACKKCRKYSVWGYTKYVVNTQTGEVVHGEMPSDEEYAEAAAAAEQRWAEEAREFEAMIEAEQERRVAAEAEFEAWWKSAQKLKRAEAEEDLLWAIQDHLMSR